MPEKKNEKQLESVESVLACERIDAHILQVFFQFISKMPTRLKDEEAINGVASVFGYLQVLTVCVQLQKIFLHLRQLCRSFLSIAPQLGPTFIRLTNSMKPRRMRMILRKC